MLTDLNKLKGMDFSKKYVEINSYEDIYIYDNLSYQQELKEYANLDEFKYVKNVECIVDVDFITAYVSYLIYGLGSGRELAIKSQHVKLSEGLEILHNNLRVEEFKSNWRKTVEEQFEARHEKVRTSSRDSKTYDKNLKHRKNNEVPYLSSSKTRIFVVEHWMGMPKGEHQRRVNEIVKNTILGDYLVGKPVLRENDWTLKTYAEYYKVKLNADTKKEMGEVEFNRLYRECCAKCGYDY